MLRIDRRLDEFSNGPDFEAGHTRTRLARNA